MNADFFFFFFSKLYYGNFSLNYIFYHCQRKKKEIVLGISGLGRTHTIMKWFLSFKYFQINYRIKKNIYCCGRSGIMKLFIGHCRCRHYWCIKIKNYKFCRYTRRWKLGIPTTWIFTRILQFWKRLLFSRLKIVLAWDPEWNLFHCKMTCS